jgi:hypothetical protein
MPPSVPVLNGRLIREHLARIQVVEILGLVDSDPPICFADIYLNRSINGAVEKVTHAGDTADGLTVRQRAKLPDISYQARLGTQRPAFWCKFYVDGVERPRRVSDPTTLRQ